MKKTAFLLVICILLAAVSCTGNTPPADTNVTQASSETTETAALTTEHTEHLYTETVVEPTKTKQGYVLHTCACGESYMDQYTGMKHTLETEKPTYKVLFIGNSYTNRSSLWDLFRNVADSAGYTVTVDYVIKGGWTLLQMADATDECGSQVDSKLKTTKYDFVFMQEQSERPATVPGMFYDGVRALSKKIADSGATPILFQTWGRKAGSETLTQNKWTSEEMTKLLANAYEAIGKECGIDVSAVGTAFYDVYTNHPEIDLYDTDGSHPSYAGSYLAALCHYAMVYGKSPVGLSYKYGVSTDEEALILQNAAHKAIFGDKLLKEDEITDSKEISGNGLALLSKIPEGSTLISAGITGSNGNVSSTATAASGTQLSKTQLEDLADINYGISIIGTKDMVNRLSNLNDGLWAKSTSVGVRTSYHFADGNKHYGIDGVEDASEKYRALITLNFGQTVTVDAVGYFSGNLNGFAQSQDVFVSNDGKTWAKIESASYTTTSGMTSISGVVDKQGNTAGVCVLFDTKGVQAKYVRVGIVVGITVNDWDMNTLEFAVYGKTAAK